MTKPNASLPKDPITGKFANGNPGRPKGSKNRRTMQWEEIGDALVNDHTERFSETLNALWNSEQLSDRVKGAELFLKVLEYFKPKRPREAPSDPTDIWNLNNLLR